MRWLVMVGAFGLGLLIAEGLARTIPIPGRQSTPGTAISTTGEAPFLHGGSARYEPKPLTELRITVSDRDTPVIEKLNNEGFRGPNYAWPKAPGTFRILALGDSVVQGFSVSHDRTWEHVLERRCGIARARSSRAAKS